MSHWRQERSPGSYSSFSPFQEGFNSLDIWHLWYLVSLFPSLSALGLFQDTGSTNSQASGIFPPFYCVLRRALQDTLLMACTGCDRQSFQLFRLAVTCATLLPAAVARTAPASLRFNQVRLVLTSLPPLLGGSLFLVDPSWPCSSSAGTSSLSLSPFLLFPALPFPSPSPPLLQFCSEV